MSLAELLPEVRGLPPADKLTLFRHLSDELSAEHLLPPGEYPVWSPLEAYEAAAALQAVLATGQGRP